MRLAIVTQDEHRLPEGMKRVGYDADTQRYYYRDGGGSLWEGPEGSQYGQLTQGKRTLSFLILRTDHSRHS